MRDSFVFYRSFAEAINKLGESDRLGVYDALCRYALDGEIVTDNGIVKAMLTLMIPQIDANNRKYENGKKGGRHKNQSETKEEPKQNQSKTKQKPKESNTEPNVNVNVNVNDNVNDNENVNIPPISPEGDLNRSQKKQADELFEELWKLYPKKEGKGSVKTTQRIKLLKIGREEMERCIQRYITAKKDTDYQYLKNGSTFFNSGYIDYLDANVEKPQVKTPEPIVEDDEEEMTDEEWLELQRKLAEQENEIHTV